MTPIGQILIDGKAVDVYEVTDEVMESIAEQHRLNIVEYDDLIDDHHQALLDATYG